MVDTGIELQLIGGNFGLIGKENASAETYWNSSKDTSIWLLLMDLIHVILILRGFNHSLPKIFVL